MKKYKIQNTKTGETFRAWGARFGVPIYVRLVANFAENGYGLSVVWVWWLCGCVKKKTQPNLIHLHSQNPNTKK